MNAHTEQRDKFCTTGLQAEAEFSRNESSHKVMRMQRYWVTNSAALSTVEYSIGTPPNF